MACGEYCSSRYDQSTTVLLWVTNTAPHYRTGYFIYLLIYYISLIATAQTGIYVLLMIISPLLFVFFQSNPISHDFFCLCPFASCDLVQQSRSWSSFTPFLSGIQSGAVHLQEVRSWRAHLRTTSSILSAWRTQSLSSDLWLKAFNHTLSPKQTPRIAF